jgi:polyisoprenoid-binding protein YceI
MKTLKLLVLATALAAAPACKKKPKESPPPTTEPGSASGAAPTPGSASGATDPTMGSGSAGSGSADPGAGSGSAAAATPDANANSLTILAEHGPEKKPDDPVKVVFSNVTVKKADFDPAKIEGGTATIEVDLLNLKSGSDKRDGHLATPDYLDTAKFGVATIDVGNVKKKDDTHFTADAKVKVKDTEKTYPVTFEILDKTADSIRIKGEQKFNRLDFKVGKPKLGKDEAVQFELTAQLQLTLKKS